MKDDIIRYKGRLCIGNKGDWRKKILYEMHGSGMGGHSRVLSTYQRLMKLFFWPKMKEMVHEYVRCCDICQMSKSKNIKTPGLLQPLSIPNEAWQCISMDFISGLPKSEGKSVILVVVDRFTKYAHLCHWLTPSLLKT
jgi:Integrase zinc binding domain